MNFRQALKKVIKPQTIVVLIVLLAANSFAWFVYGTKVRNNITAHVKAWKVIFEAGDNEITDYVDVNVDTMYPGMQDFQYEINAYNRSEMAATLSYEIMEISIMGDVYKTKNKKIEDGEEVLPEDLTSDQLLEKLETEFPFTINLSVSSSTMSAETGEAFYRIEVKWPFESGDDDLDTYWGKRAAVYEQEHPDSPSITLVIKISIIQVTD